MRQLYDKVEAAGVTRGTILIVGESGTGKELVAHAIHECGPQPATPFVALNCAAVPKDLIESEMFGYKRGAFSGANADYLGLFRAADRGTLFLDEVTEMSADTQSKLLRAIQERTVRPVGSTKEVAVDVRLIASTNRDPQEAVKEGSLREDLYYRLQASVMKMPPLRERAEDVPLLVEHFIELFNEKADARNSSTGDRGRSYRGDGGIFVAGQRARAGQRDRGCVYFQPVAGDPVAGPASLDLRFVRPPNGSQPGRQMPVGTFADAERDLIRRALEATEGNKVHAAKLLEDLSQKTLRQDRQVRLGANPAELA